MTTKLVYDAAFKEAAIRDARALGVRAAARKHGVSRKELRAWRTDADLRLAQPSADEIALLERANLTAKDLPAITRLRSRGIDYALSRETDPADLPPYRQPPA